jgi:pyruvate,orthophosphate dikinase
VILVRRETNPDDLEGMIAARGILTSRGGKTSHAAVVARGMGKTCVCGAEELDVDTKARTITAGNVVIREGDVVSIDGSSGAVYLGEVPVMPSPVVEYFEGRLLPDAAEADDLVKAVHRLITHADAGRRLKVRTNADTPEDSARARRMGAEGIGLCRTEHMFLGDRAAHVEALILATTDDQRAAALEALEPLQKKDCLEIFEAMDGLPVTVRLIDPPLHEFLPDLTELAVKVAVAEATGIDPGHDKELLAAVSRLHEANPMLGLRGVRLGVVIPGLFAMQVRAIAEAAAERKAAGGNPQPEVMIPLVGAVQELELMRDEAVTVITAVERESGQALDIPVGTMIELPRAALTAGQIAEAADFFSYGTNDLTQTTWGFSRDDVEAAFFTQYLEKGRRPPGETGPEARGLRRARRRPGLDPFLRRGRAGLRVLLALPGSGGAARGGPRGRVGRRERQPLNRQTSCVRPNVADEPPRVGRNGDRLAAAPVLGSPTDSPLPAS